IPPRPSGDACLRLRNQQGDRHGAGPHHRGHAGRPHARDVGEPPPGAPLPPVGPHADDRRGARRPRRPHRGPPARRRAAVLLRRPLAGLVHQRVRRYGPALLAAALHVPEPAAAREPVVPRPRHGPHARQHPRGAHGRVPRRQPRRGRPDEPAPRGGVRPEPRAVRPRLPRRRRGALHEPHGQQPRRAPAVEPGVLRRSRRRQRQGVAVPPRAPPPLPLPHPQRQQRALLPAVALRGAPLRARRVRLGVPRQAGSDREVRRGAVRDRRRRRRLRGVGRRRGGRPQRRRPGPVPRRPRREGGDHRRDEVRGRGRRGGPGHVDRAGDADAALPQAGRARGGHGATHHHVRVHQGRHGRADAPVPERALVHGPGDGDAQGRHVGGLGGDQPHGRQPSAARAPGGVRGAGAAVAAPRGRVQGLHEAPERRARVRGRPPPGRRAEARRAAAGARLEERLQGAAQRGNQDPRALQAAHRRRVAGGEPLPLRRHHWSGLRVPLP
ncbi:hypothetical protein ACJX0J_015628, partial [Zea mays]